ncbi:MAG: PTS sugar transporter subunit IIA [Candidatus Omnitrophica bacterium]|nr:PTS sugar transporter subunit IIA [Candidatus Omnitrophota bacterium]
MLERFLTIKDVSELLQVNERTIHRLIQAKKIHATKIGSQWRFHPALLEEWFLNGGEQELSDGGGDAPWRQDDEFRIVSPDRTLLALEASNRRQVFELMIDTLVATGHLLQKTIFLQEVIKREDHLSTGIGNGVALPHAWHPVNDLFHVPLVVCARLKDALDFQSVDGEPVDLVFLLCAPRNRLHLKLLSTMAAAAKDPLIISKLRAADEAVEFCSILEDVLSPLAGVL